MATPEEVRCIATQAAQEAVSQCLLKLGIDSDDASSVIEFQRDLSELREMVRSFRELRSKGTVAVMLVILTAVLGMVWMGFKSSLK